MLHKMTKLNSYWLIVFVSFTSVSYGEEEIIYPVTNSKNDWWSNTIIYQVYPRSFKDSDNDGIGDLKGITEELDHFVDLGIEIVWINPIFKSPMYDMGYDVENYTTIDPMFGSMEDFEELISEMNKRNLKLIIDFVPNHSSDQCEWFLKSIKKEGKYDEYYVWRNASNQDQLSNTSITPTPPNNWLSKFGGSAWSWNTERKQFYLHQFSDKQPDLNFRNSEVHKEILNILEFWMDKGVAGFRFSAVGKLYEDKDFQNEPKSVGRENWPIYYSLDHIYTHDQPEVIDTIIEWRKFMDDYSNRRNTFPRLLAAEAHHHVCVFSLRDYYGNENNPGAQIPFNFHLLIQVRKNDLVYSVDRAIKFWFEVIPANNTPNWVMETHDTDRISSKYGSEMVQVFTALKLSLPGIDVTYYGSEIGMENVYVRPDQIQDSYDSSGQRNIESRDFARSPMEWNGKSNAGFTEAKKPWLPINPNYYKINVEEQKKISTSNYNFYKKMSQLRKTDTLKYGDLKLYNITDSIYIVKRSLSGRETYLTVMNFGSETETVILSEVISNLKKKLYVYLGSENSAHSQSDIVSTISIVDNPLHLRPQSVVVLTDNLVNVDTFRNNAISYRKYNTSYISILCALLLIVYHVGIRN
ncbi:maltase A3-like [Rhopalosiphum maidis]|uniref:maltase A3-like n=1 Tax=Rhopalosiphum maidis TaxID=43146 RepID=UPI000F007862|nr:maltase A3-like [Rhopalosiphum maidis]XP_026808058.1 maltase A3-like [Rhopalosiphum maidis]